MNRIFTGITLFIITLITAVQPGNAQVEPKRVLFIGNSFLAFNNAPLLVNNFADADTIPSIIRSHLPGGATVKYIPQGTFAHANNPDVYDLIRSEPWDFIVVQDNQGFFVNPDIGDFHPSGLVIEGHRQLRDSLTELSNSCGKLLLFSGWIDKDPLSWAPELEMATAQVANERVFLQYQFLNAEIGQIIAPIGMAWNYVLDEMPEMELFAEDNYHPTYAGSYLTAAVIYGLAFNKEVTDNTFRGILDAEKAKQLRIRADRAIANFKTQTNIQSIRPDIWQSEDEIYAPDSFLTYQWYKDGILIEGSTSHFTEAASNSCYHVVVTDHSGCLRPSMQLCTGTGSSGIFKDKDQTLINVYPNPGTDQIEIDLRAAGTLPAQLSVIDINGRRLIEKKITSRLIQIDISGLSDGIYMIQFTDGSYSRFVKKH